MIHELLRPAASTSTIWCATPTRTVLVIDEPGAADDGLFARDADGRLLAWDRSRANRTPTPWQPTSSRRSTGQLTLCRRAQRTPVFQLIAERYLDAAVFAGRGRSAMRRAGRHHPAASPPNWRTPRSIRRSNCRSPGRTGPAAGTTAMRGRPVAMHAMRGIRAHATASRPAAPAPAAIAARRHRVPGRIPLPAAVPEADAAGQRRPARTRQAPIRRCRACRSASSRAGRPAGRFDRRAAADRQGLFVGSAARIARHDAYGDPQRLARRSVPDRYAVHVHGQHELELGDEHGGHARHAHRQGRRRRIQDPVHHLLRCVLLGDGRV